MSNISSISNMSVNVSDNIRYIIMQIFYIPSLICSIFTLIHFLFNRNLRSNLHNHILLALLIISTCDLLFNHPFTLNYLRIGQVMPSTDSMCRFWNFLNAICNTSTYFTIAWSSIERYFLIFYSSLYSTQRRRILFHYIPLFLTSCIYPLIINITIMFIYPCQNRFNMISLYCGYTCSLKIPSIALYVRIVHNFVPTFIVFFATLILIICVVKQKQQTQNNRFNWRRYRRMAIQLLVIASIFLIFTLPATIVSVVQYCCLSTFAVTIQTTYFNYLLRFITIFLPFICFSFVSEIWPKWLPCKQVQVHMTRSIQIRTNRAL